VDELGQASAELFQQHPDYAIITSFPGLTPGPRVERAIAWVASQGGRRLNLRYLGVDKNDFWLQMRIGVLNLRRLLALGFTHHAGSWTMA
jgi:hypothetical protein